MAKRGENIYKRKDGRYEGRYKVGMREDGRIRYGYVYAYSYREVKRKLNECKALRSQTHIGSHAVSVNDLIVAWLAATKIAVKESSYARYVSVLQRHILPEFGGMKAARITTEQLNSFVGDKLSEGLSPTTVCGIVNLIYSVFSFGEREYGLKNPALHVSRPKRSKRDVDVLSAKEWERLRTYTAHGEDYSKLGVLLCLYTGIRIGELCALKVSNLHLGSGVLRVDSTMQRVQNTEFGEHRTRVIIGSPKSASSAREIPLPLFLLQKLKKAYAHIPANAFLLTGSVNKYVEPRVFQKRFKRYLRECGIAEINFHVLRHSFATHCVINGGDVKSLSEILGHSNVSMTLSKYVHSSMDNKRRQIELLAAANE